MDQVKVAEQREAPPSWAKPEAAAEDPNPELWTGPQKQFVLDLIAKKDISGLNEESKEFLEEISSGQRVMTKGKASQLIDKMLKLKDKPKEERQIADVIMQVPAGRYALPKTGSKDPNEIRFYQVWESRDKKAKRIYVLFGPYESRLPYPAQVNIANLILKNGVEECAIRFGMEIGSCSNCGRRLTNRISRELGIGPVCGGRMFESDVWKVKVKAKRAEIKARGEDPDEELDD